VSPRRLVSANLVAARQSDGGALRWLHVGRYTRRVTFRDRLLATLRALEPVLSEPGVMIVGSEVPNLMQPAAASTLVVSMDVDIAVPVDRVREVKARLRHVRGLVASADEPSVFVPTSDSLIEANFLGLDRTIRDAAQTYVLDDPDLPLMVFGPLGRLRPGPVVEIDGLGVPLPNVADLILEKLMTDRTGEKGVRDLLVVAGLLAVTTETDVDAVVSGAADLPNDVRYAVRSGLTVLSLMAGVRDMPDPSAVRGQLTRLLDRIEAHND
jgi:hypothetical protein